VADLKRLTQQEAAWLIGVTPRALRDMDAPRAADGSYCGATLVKWRFQKTFSSQRERLHSAQAEKAELDLAVRRGELLEAEEVVKTWSDHIARARLRLRSIPHRVAAQIAIKKSALEIARLLLDEIDEALTELAGEPKNEETTNLSNSPL
jgi:phage terminase Nu1 subunit (DNA packaging protein)